jgi:hypothetical protein
MADLTKIEATVGLWTLGGLKPDMPTVSGRTALIHRLAVRLQTPRGRFRWWPNFGTDMTQFLNSKARPSVIASAAEAECLKDEQVESVVATAELLDSGRTLRLVLVIEDAEGPFRLTLDIAQAKLTLIELQAA